MTPRSCSGSRPQAPSSSARPTATSSRWDRPPRIPRTAPCGIHGRPIVPRAARAAARLRPSPRAARRWPLARTPADRFGSPRRSAVSSIEATLRASFRYACWRSRLARSNRNDREDGIGAALALASCRTGSRDASHRGSGARFMAADRDAQGRIACRARLYRRRRRGAPSRCDGPSISRRGRGPSST